MAKKISLEVKQRRYGYLFTLPFIIGAVLFIVFPLIVSFVCSFATVKQGSGFMGYDYSNWGMVNYSKIWIESNSFAQLVLDSLVSMLTTVPVVVIFAFFMASVLNAKFRGRGFARSVMFMPVIISSGLIVGLSGDALASQMMSGGSERFAETAASTGAIQVTDAFQMMLEEMDVADWMVDLIIGSVSGISTIVSMSAVSIVIFIAGLQSISPSIYEASYIEGATKWEVFWKISLPMVSPLILLSVVYTIVDNFNGSTNAVVETIHNNIIGMKFDIASAMAVSYSLIILVILAVVFAVLNKIVFYQD
ncbi:MAG: sugar ABC transporter permease [Acutalibacteraceae bacterium]|nr:sugar ABC transporter permease [Acutalibacteraceae bacterium]